MDELIAPMELSQPILIIEDNDGDYEAIVRAFKQIPGFEYRIDRCIDGEEAIGYLLRQGAFASLREYNLPGLLLVDLNMPGPDGIDVLKTIQSKKHLGTIPAIVLTASHETKDIQDAYSSGANTFIEKPQSTLELTKILHKLAKYWLDTATLPAPSFDPLAFQMHR